MLALAPARIKEIIVAARAVSKGPPPLPADPRMAQTCSSNVTELLCPSLIHSEYVPVLSLPGAKSGPNLLRAA